MFVAHPCQTGTVFNAPRRVQGLRQACSVPGMDAERPRRSPHVERGDQESR